MEWLCDLYAVDLLVCDPEIPEALLAQQGVLVDGVVVLFVPIFGFLAAFRKVGHWTVFYFFVICIVEVPLILAVVDWTFDRFGKRHHSGDGASHM
jgi:hypothetical protein